MWNWLDKLLGVTKTPKEEEAHFERIGVQNNPWCIAAYRGYLPQTGLEYTIMLSHLRDIPEQSRMPYKHFPSATHDLIIWYHLYRNNKKVNKVLHHKQYNFGWWKIQFFQDKKSQWQNPAMYRKAIAEIDGCAMLVVLKIIKELKAQQYTKYLEYTKYTSHFWEIVVADASESCPNLVPPIADKLENVKLKTDGINVWIDDSINLDFSD